MLPSTNMYLSTQQSCMSPSSTQNLFITVCTITGTNLCSFNTPNRELLGQTPRPDPLLLLVRPIDRVPPPTPTLLTHQHFNQRAVRGSPCKLLHMFISSVTESKSDLNTRRPHRRGKVARMSTYAGWGAEDGKTFVRSPSHISEPRKWFRRKSTTEVGLANRIKLFSSTQSSIIQFPSPCLPWDWVVLRRRRRSRRAQSCLQRTCAWV